MILIKASFKMKSASSLFRKKNKIQHENSIIYHYDRHLNYNLNLKFIPNYEIVNDVNHKET